MSLVSSVVVVGCSGFETIKKALSRYVHAGASIQKVKQAMQELYDVRDNVRERGKLHRRLEKDVRSTRARQAAQTRRREAVVMPSETQELLRAANAALAVGRSLCN